MTKVAMLTIPLGLMVSLFSTPAKATLEWYNADLPVGGCAMSIGVGPNDVPWITGCEPELNHVISYLDHPGSNCGLTGCPAQWHGTSGRAATVSVDINGDVFAVVADGSIYVATGGVSDSNKSYPDGGWWHVPTPSGCVTALAPTREIGDDGELFVAPVQNNPSATPLGTFWALGCDSSIEKSIFKITPNTINPGAASWQNVPGSATAIALFNIQSVGAGLYQTPWVLNSTHEVYAFNGAGFREMGPPGFPAAITDHFAISSTFSTKRVPGGRNVYRWDDVSQTWSEYMTAMAPNGVPITQIASSEAFNTVVGRVGPSRLWGLDAAGNIYYATTAAPLIK